VSILETTNLNTQSESQLYAYL